VRRYDPLMPTRLPLLFCALLPAALAAGCSPYRTEKFDISVRNATTQPVTISLAKDGPPFEDAWASPEDVAIQSARYSEDAGGKLVPPGKTAFVNNLSGKFDRNTRGFVRVYAGKLKLSEALARSPGSPGRVDVQLAPGRNDIRVYDNGGYLVAEATAPDAQ
jgi:hypothetical protein